MEKVKTFISDHKKEIAIGFGFIIFYKIGFNTGCKATDKAVKNLINQAYRATSIHHF